MTPAMRSAHRGEPRIQDAIKALGTEAGIVWLEAHIESPVGREWGLALFALNPPWHHLNRWIRLSKLHCLAAIDVLFYCSDANGGRNRRIPDGANPKSINEAVDYALAHYGNPRLEAAAQEIRYAWPKGDRKRHNINVPTSLLDAAGIVLCHDADLMIEWQETMARAKQQASTPFEIWDSLSWYSHSQNSCWQ